MTNALTAELMGDRVATGRRSVAEVMAANQGDDSRQVRWFRPLGRMGALTVTVNKKGELLIGKSLLTALVGEGAEKGATLFVRVGQLDSGDLVIERIDGNNAMARKVFSNGIVSGGGTREELEAAGFASGRYPARINQQGTIVLVKKP